MDTALCEPADIKAGQLKVANQEEARRWHTHSPRLSCFPWRAAPLSFCD